jgi:hypothetical protein
MHISVQKERRKEREGWGAQEREGEGAREGENEKLHARTRARMEDTRGRRKRTDAALRWAAHFVHAAHAGESIRVQRLHVCVHVCVTVQVCVTKSTCLRTTEG